MKYLIILSIFTFLLSCTGKRENDISYVSVKEPDATKLIPDTKSENDSLILEESFIDSLNIGVKGKNKIELQQFRTPDSVFVIIKLFGKSKKEWKKLQSFEFLKDGITSSNAKIKDFNNDGLCDMTFQSSIAGRGANELRKLFIFNKEAGELVLMKNSEKYPNMLYNKELDCIDAFLVYGCSSSVFLKIEKDSLREFAGVDIGWGELESYIVNKKGERISLKKDSNYEASYVRFMNYKTLKIYEDY